MIPPVGADQSLPTQDATVQAPQDLPQTPKLIDQINDDDLSVYILARLRSDIRARDNAEWQTRRNYDILAYDGYKQAATAPWHNASNFPVPLTSTLLDTGHSHTVQSIWSNPKQVVRVEGVGAEDERNAKSLEQLLNWQILNEIENAYGTTEVTVKRGFKHGNAVIKVIHGAGPQKSKIIWSPVPFENIFLPLTARGAQSGNTDHIFELIPLDENDWEKRRSLANPDGTPFYKGIEDLPKGNTVLYSGSIGTLVNTNDVTSGTQLGTLYSNEYRYIMECYLTYYFKPQDAKPEDPSQEVELIVWIAPNGGQILKKVINPDLDEDTGEYVRPYSVRWIPYPRDDRFIGDSLPWLIKPIQEELDYAHNQNLNAAEIAIKPPKFYRSNSGFDPELYETTPDGWYPTNGPPAQDIYIPVISVNSVMERQEDKYWDLAERRTGFTELFQGRAPDSRQTATLTLNRENKSEVRFGTIYKRFGQGFNELIQLTYFYDKKYMPPDVKVKALGYSDYRTVEQLFPNGIRGRFNFFFSSKTLVEQDLEKQNAEKAYMAMMGNPSVNTNPASMWKALDYYCSVACGIRSLDSIIQKPQSAEILSPDEALRRILSGEYDVQPDVNIDAPYYLIKVQQFMKTDMFLQADQQVQQAVMVLLQRIQAIQAGQNLAMHDSMVLQQAAMGAGQAANGMQPQGDPGQPPPQEQPGQSKPMQG